MAQSTAGMLCVCPYIPPHYYDLYRLEKTGFSPEAEAQLERDRRSLNRPPEKELDITYTPNVNLLELRRTDSFLNTTS